MAPETIEDAWTFGQHKERKHENEDNCGDKVGDSADGGREEITEIVDDATGEGAQSGDDLGLRIFDAEALGKIVDGSAFADAVANKLRQVAGEFDRFVDDGWADDGDDADEEANY